MYRLIVLAILSVFIFFINKHQLTYFLSKISYISLHKKKLHLEELMAPEVIIPL